MFGIKRGDTVKIKKTGTDARVLDVSYDKIFIETTSKRFGKVYKAWINKSDVRR